VEETVCQRSSVCQSGLGLVRLPEKIRGVLEKLVRDLGQRETVLGVGLFGSWSRGDAVVSSDVDLLVVDKQNRSCEYVERLELGDVLFDLNYVPLKWVLGQVPPQIDQKLFETHVLYDRDWSLTNTKDWMAKAFRKPERVNIRSEAYLVDADVYVSRAASACARGDLQSAVVFASVSLESFLKTLIEVSVLPVSNSHFVRALEESCKKLGLQGVFANFIKVSMLDGVSYREADKKLGLFRVVWSDISSFLKDHALGLDSVHFKVKSKLNYYGKPAFLRGMIARGEAIINSGAYAEACLYVSRTLIDALENYAYLASAAEDTRLDYTALFRSLRGLRETSPRVYEAAVEAFDVRDISRKRAEDTLKLAKETLLHLRRQRRDLVQNLVKAA